MSGPIESRPVISQINLAEDYHRLERDHGRDAADDTLSLLRASLAPDLPGTARMIVAARLKARAPIAPGDCFLATSERTDACTGSSPSLVHRVAGNLLPGVAPSCASAICSGSVRRWSPEPVDLRH